VRRVELTGTPYEMGIQHGTACAEAVNAAIERVVNGSNVDAAHRERVVRQMERTVDGVFPEALEEMQGIADGAGLSRDDILAYASCMEIGRTAVGCTNVALHTDEHGVVHYKSNDVGKDSIGSYVFWNIRPDKGHPFICISGPGAPWMGPGVNDTGLTFGGSSIMNTDQDWEYGIPTNLLQRYLLQYCADVEEGIALCESTPIMNHGMNIMLTDAADNAVVVERSAKRMAVRRMENNAIWCANHYETAEMLDVDDRSNAEFRANSEGRAALLAELTEDEEPHSLDKVKRIARTHADPVSMCQHGPMHSAFGLIMISRDRTLLASDGYPCENELEEFVFDSQAVAANN
jgi:isopenicillin-N N-acyltransferase-like protein